MIHIPPALKNRRFFYLWSGQLLSIAGTQMQLWALYWHIHNLTDEPIALGGVGLARILPVIIFSLVGGVVADTFDRRKVILITQSAAALTALALGLLTDFGQINIWLIYALTAFQAIAVAFDSPARQALIPNLVAPRDLPNAFSMTSIAHETGAIIGPALTGFAIALGGQEAAYYINAASYLAVIGALFMIGPIAHTRSPRPAGAALSSIQEGIHFILNKPIILSTMLTDFVATFFVSANTLMPIIAQDILKVGVVEYGWLSAAQSAGAVTAGLIVSQLPDLRRQGQLFLGSVFIFGAATILFGASRILVLSWFALALIGAADAVSTIVRNTIRQLQTPDHLRGRMTSVNQIFFQGGPQLGEVEAGLVAQLFGAPFALISGGIGCIVGLWLIVRKWPLILSYNGDEHLPAGVPAD